MGCSSTKLRKKVNATVESPQSPKHSHLTVFVLRIPTNLFLELLFHNKNNHLGIEFALDVFHNTESNLLCSWEGWPGSLFWLAISLLWFEKMCLLELFLCSRWFEKVKQAGWLVFRHVAFIIVFSGTNEPPTFTTNLVEYLPLPFSYYPVSLNDML